MLWLLLIVPFVIGAYIFMQRRRRRFALRYASLSLVKEAVGKGPGFKRHIPPAIFIAALGVMIFALSRPSALVTLPSMRSTVILTVDVSGSMRAEDLKPNRMEAAKAAARAFVDKQPDNVKIGVVSFSAHAALIQEPTVDREKVLAAINRLRTQRGTAVGSGILTSLEAILMPDGRKDAAASRIGPSGPLFDNSPRTSDGYAPAVIVLLTDGQSNQGPSPMDMAAEAAAAGIRIFTVGVGSKAGSVIGVQGRSIRVLLDEDNLQDIARETDGEYYTAETEAGLRGVYETLSTNLVMETEKTELTAFFTAFGALLLLISGTLSLLWFSRLP
jgi:Ca-activated chloride channel homolog